MIKKYIDCCVITVGVAMTACFPSIEKISSFNYVEFNKITADTLVIFDVDQTLIYSIDSGLVEPEIISQLQLLKNNNVPFIACTAMQAEQGSFKACIERRYEHLKLLGFEASYIDLIFSVDISSKRLPLFYKGILGTNSEQKGIVIGVFLDITQISPKNIMMFDDNPRFLQTVQQECKKRGIRFIGYLYTGAQK